MAWPGITDFSEAVQNPGLCFKGTALEAGAVAQNQRGTPLVFSGAFACVYSVSDGAQTFAVRCFTREVKDQESRYNHLGQYLLHVLPPSFVHFEFLHDGISVRGDWYPIVRMEWVEGESLSSFVEANLNDPDTLRRIAAQWRGGPVASLRGLGIAHNDLQHGNVMVDASGRIRLVDYDGMFLPRFKGERSPELGHKHYQHPLRSADDYDAWVDNFPALVIYLSLTAIASDPGLWSYNNDDNLIFTRGDYADPANSALFQQLKGSSDKAVVMLTERLEEYCALPVPDVPDLETILQGVPLQATPPATRSARQPAASAPAAAPAASTPSAPAPAAAAPSAPAPASSPSASPAQAPSAPTTTFAPSRSAPSRTFAPPRSRSTAAFPTPGPSPGRRVWTTIFHGHPPGELRKVALGVAATAVAVAIGLGAMVGLALAVRGWD